MSYGKPNANYTVPIAESTQIEDSPRASPSQSKFLWGGKYTPRNNKMSSMQSQQSPNALEKSINSPRPKALDAKIYRDTLSSGLTSRVNKYAETSTAKSRPIANRTYSRPGDFPIVNLEKSEINIKPRQTNGATIAKIGVGAPLRLNNQASIRSTIFRTGKNYGDTAPITAANNIDVTNIGSSSASSNGSGGASCDDEPIVPTSSEYDANPTRSSLDALVEISRKRTHYDDLDGDFMKKQRADKSPNASAQIIRQSSPPPNQIAKRGRDRTSPSYYNNAAETQKKRYRNNDILSSLSSSIHLNSPKSVRTVLDFDFDGEKSNATKAQDKNTIKERSSLHSAGIERNGIEIATLNNNEIVPPKSQSSLQHDLPPKVQKLTLFNKIYEPSVIATSKDKNAKAKSDLDDSTSEEYEDNRISFVKPKTKTSTVFKVNRNGMNAKTKLAIMLSYFTEGDSCDEVDNGVRTDETQVDKLPSVIVGSSTAASLSTGEKTTVTFSTATTTSVLSLPSVVTTPETQKVGMNIVPLITEVSKAIKSIPIATIETSTENNAVALPKSTPLPTFGEQTRPTISFAVNAATAASTTNPTTNSVTFSEAVSPLGGFSFANTMTTPSPLIASKSAANLNDSQKTKNTENIVPTSSPLPAFSFEKSATSTSNTTPLTGFSFGKPATPTKVSSTLAATATSTSDVAKTVTAAGGFSFGGTNAPSSTTLNTSFGTIVTTTTSAQSMAAFSFGKNLNGSTASTMTAVPTATPPTFGTQSFGAQATLPSYSFTATSTVASTGAALSTTTTTSSTTPSFDFNTPKSNGLLCFGTPTPSEVAGTTSSLPASSFTFGTVSTAVASANPSPFGITNTNTTTPNLFGTKIENTSASTLTTQAPATNLFGTPTATPTATTSIPSFGSSSTSFNSIATTTIPSFGGSFNRNSATITTTAPPAFGTSTTTFNSSAATPVFGAFGTNSNATPAFGSTSSFGAPVVTTAAQTSTTNLFGAPQKSFGSMPTCANPVFGSSSQPPNTDGANLFGSNNSTATSNFTAPPLFGTTATPLAQPATGSGVFGFGQTAVPTTTASSGGIFGNTSTNTNSAFTFGQTANPAASGSTFASLSNDTNTPFGFNAGTNSNTTAPPAFGSSSPAFNFAPKTASPFGAPAAAAATETKSSFSFNTVPNANATSVTAFNSAPPNVSPFGNTNSNAAAATVSNSSFSFGASTNEAPKSFGFGTTTTENSTNNNMFGAQASAPSPFAFGAPAATGIVSPNANAFQFNAQQPAATNLFSIGPGNSSTAPKNRPIRQATRRINK